MSKHRVLMLCVLLAVAAVLVPRPASAADTYEAVVEYDGPYFRVVNAPTINQLVDDPKVEMPFITPYGLAVSEETGAGLRIMNYVLDSGNKRLLGFESHMEIEHQASSAALFNSGDDAAGEWNATLINLTHYVDGAASATNWVIPHSEVLKIGGVVWSWVASLTGFTASDKVYTIDYDAIGAGAADGAPKITLPAASLSATSTWTVDYCYTVNSGAGTAAFGTGEIDQNCSDAAAVAVVEISQTSPSAADFQDLRAIFIIDDCTATTTDEVWIVDAADNSTNGDEFLQVYSITEMGTEAFVEKYDDLLSEPSDVYVSCNGSYTIATCPNPATTFTSATVIDANQITGHRYQIKLLGAQPNDPVTVTDMTTGRVIVNGAHWTDLPATSSTTYIIPGVDLQMLSTVLAGDVTEYVTTVRTVYQRYAFVCDRGNNRIKVVSYDDFARTGDVLPGDAHTCVTQPTAGGGLGTVCQSADADYYVAVPATVPENWQTATLTRPVKENSIAIIEDPDVTPITWTRVDDINTAGPTDKVFELDWYEGFITFGDGTHGAKPTASADLKITYTTTPDIMRYGSNGGGEGQFSGPTGICAKWCANLGAFVVYVADTGNNRIQKLLFYPEDAALQIPPRMSFVCEWNTATTATDHLNGPTDIDIEAIGTAPSESYYIAVVDHGNDRVVMYKDTKFEYPDATVPAFETTIGGSGNALGTYSSISAVDLLRAPCATAMGTELEIYLADDSRGVITKYVKAPAPTITLTFTGTSTLPASFPPSSSYPIRYTVTNCPSGGWVDFYFDTASTFDETTASVSITLGASGCDDSPVTWSFADSPGGTPADGTYYLYARLKDAGGNTVASDQAQSTELLTIDSNLVPTLQARDDFDNDSLMLLAPNETQTILLELAYPDSVIACVFSGTFPSEILQVQAISPGDGWEGTEYIQHIWSSDYDNTAGTFNVYTSITNSPIGLSNGRNVMARMNVTAVAALTDTVRFKTGTIVVDGTKSEIKDIHGNVPSEGTTSSLAIKLAYIGDVADGSDLGSVPTQQASPDGYMNFDDMTAFTLGWNGSSNTQDPLADMGPVTGTSPNLIPSRDGLWDVDDLMAYTENWTWFTNNGYGAPQIFNAMPGIAFTPLGEPVEGATSISLSSGVQLPLPGHTFTVDVHVDDADMLTAVMVRVAYDPAELTLVGTEKGELLQRDDSNVLFHTTSREGTCELCLGRLNRAKPGVSGDGIVASLTFQITTPPESGLGLAYDLRDATGDVLARGSSELEGFAGGLVKNVILCQNYPNPLNPNTSIVFTLPSKQVVSLAVYDLSGRCIKTLVNGSQDAGIHTIEWSGRDQAGAPVASGVYFYKLRAGDVVQSRKLVITR
ncbi:MAG: T9SS type A sorting domain-containing protein [Candidatus Eisenbacteria sp.]|nr:T9SS type A sorting domain-containing protein [Candidatus Eisenbacteria bacterium]